MKKAALIMMALSLSCWPLCGQDTSIQEASEERVETYKPGESQFMLRGYAQGSFTATKDDNSFNSGSFVPLFIYQHNDRLIFESELEFAYENGELETVLEYANVSYKLGKGAWVRAGKILVPFGNFFDRFHPAWINPLPTMPLGYGHDGVLPTSDLGVELRSGLYLGNMKMNYSLYVLNGPQLNDGDHEPDEIGMITHGATSDNNNNKALGGRLGIFPFNDSSLELGFSGQTGKIGSKDSEFEGISSQLYALDISYVKNLNFLKSVINVKGQGNLINVEDRIYEIEHEDGDMEVFDFDNKVRSFYSQISLRPSLVNSDFVRSLEFVARYSKMKHPEGAPWEANPKQWAFGVNYWVNWRTALKVAYQIDKSSSEHQEVDENAEPGGHGVSADVNTFYVQWAIGL